MIHGYSSLPHYGAHIQPILDALPAELRGEMWTPGERKPWGLAWGPQTPAGGLWMVAGYADARRLHGRPLVYVEHGAGQSYPGRPESAGHGAFSGGAGLDHVRLFICPSETVAQRWRDRYPDCSAAAVGSPKMDRYHVRAERLPRQGGGDPRVTPERGPGSSPGLGPVVAVTFHHDNAQIPEQNSAWTHFRDAMPALRDAVADMGGQLYGHGHPRAWEKYRRFWHRIGVPCTPDLSDVFDRAHVLVMDNTSAGPEAASIGIPLVWLTPPWYTVAHGGRFFEWPRGQVDVHDPADLIDGVRRALTDPPDVRAARERMVRSIYAFTDGRASERAARAVVAEHGRVQ